MFRPVFSRRTAALLLLALAFFVVGVLPANAAPRARAMRLPFFFEQNRGQFDSSVRFRARRPGYDLFLTGSEAVIAPRGGKAVRLRYLGASPAPTASGRDALPGKVNYFVGSDAAKWRTGVPTFRRAALHSLYPGVDVVYYGAGDAIEHDFHVVAGADPARIRFRVEGGKARIDAAGDLRVGGVPGADVRWRRPVAYQEVEGKRRPVASKYAMARDGTVGFRLGRYDRTRPLVIDPVLVYASYLGGSNGDWIYDAASDADGNLVIAGFTSSRDLPPTDGAYQVPRNGTATALVAKIARDGASLLYLCYLGGGNTTSAAHAMGVAIDSVGDVLVTGGCSPDFPWQGNAFRTGGTVAGFLAKLSADGTQLLSSALLPRLGARIALGVGGLACVVGAGITGETTAGAVQPAAGTATDLWIAQFDLGTTGNASLTYATFLGGNGVENPYGLAVDSSGAIYVSGATSGNNRGTVFPTTAGALRSVGGTSDYEADGFVAKIDPTVSGSAGLIFSTLIGGRGGDSVKEVLPQADGSVWIAGQTNSSDFPVDSSSVRPAPAGIDLYIARVNATGSAMLQSTLIGGSDNDSVEHLLQEPDGAFLLVGSTNSTNFPVTADAYQKTMTAGTGASYLLKLHADGNQVLYSTYLTGSRGSGARRVVRDGQGGFYVAGMTSSSDFPVTSGALQTGAKVTSTTADGFFARFDFTSEQTLHSVSVTPASLTGGEPAQAQVRLAFPSAVGGTTISLVSNNPAVAMPDTVTVPAGTTTVSVPLATQPVTVTVTATIIATLGSATVTATLNVRPVSWQAMDIAQSGDGSLRLLMQSGEAVRLQTWTGSMQIGTGYAVATGWTPVSIAAATEGNTYLLLKNGTASFQLWIFNSMGTRTATLPARSSSGWAPTDASVGSDGAARVLLVSPTGQMRLACVSGSTIAYGPIYKASAGWTPASIGTGADNKTRVLLRNGTAAYQIWTMTAASTLESNTSPRTSSGWTARELSQSGDGSTRVLLVSPTQQVRLVNQSGTAAQVGPIYAASTGWSVVGVSADPDSSGRTRLLWRNVNGALSLWTLGPTGALQGAAALGTY